MVFIDYTARVQWPSRRAAVFLLLLAWCGGLLGLRILRSGTFSYLFLLWNLFLAAIPAVAAALLVKTCAHHRRITIPAVLFLLVWIAFLPNAPYIITDFVHLRHRPPVPLWFDVALLASAAATGILLGYTSVADVQGLIRARFGGAISWGVALGALFLSGLGIYMGRFLRWNSWEVATDPLSVAGYFARGALHPTRHVVAVAVTVIYGAALAIGYVAFVLVAMELGAQSERHPS